MKRQASKAGGGLSRRRFLGSGATVAAVAAGAALGAAVPDAAAGATPTAENPWRYDVDRLRQVDPARIGYERVGGFDLGTQGGRCLVWDGADRILVGTGRGVRGYRASGAAVEGWEAGGVVRAIAVGANGRRFVALRDHVAVFDRGGEPSGRWPVVGGRPFLTGLAVADDAVFVADSGNRVVYRCDFSGQVQVRIGDKNPGAGVPGLVLPSPHLDVELDREGKVWVNNPGRHRVEVYSRDGELERSWGRPGVALESFCGCCNPVALSLGVDGRVITAEKGLPRVKVYDPAGVMETVVAGPAAFAPVGSDERPVALADTAIEGLDVAVGPDGRVAVLDLPGRAVHFFRRKAADTEGTRA